MNESAGVDLPLMAAWTAARSLSRGLPAPVLHEGGLRVDTGLPDERRRYLFVDACGALRDLGLSIDEPFVALKLCRPAEELLVLLPPRWAISSRSWVMSRDRQGPTDAVLPPGFALSVAGGEGIWSARIADGTGMLAASGHAVEHDGVFIYDRIRTEPAQERRGLGRALMGALARCRSDAASREILTATAAGRALYQQLGWHDLALYSTATIPARA